MGVADVFVAHATVDEQIRANGLDVESVKAAVNDRGKLFEGMNVRVSIHRSLEKQLVVPKGAVVLRSGKQVVFVLDSTKTKVNWAYVHTGLENADSYTIVDGLKEDDFVITSGNINLAHEAPVKVIDN